MDVRRSIGYCVTETGVPGRDLCGLRVFDADAPQRSVDRHIHVKPEMLNFSFPVDHLLRTATKHISAVMS